MIYAHGQTIKKLNTKNVCCTYTQKVWDKNTQDDWDTNTLINLNRTSKKVQANFF